MAVSRTSAFWLRRNLGRPLAVTLSVLPLLLLGANLEGNFQQMSDERPNDTEQQQRHECADAVLRKKLSDQFHVVLSRFRRFESGGQIIRCFFFPDLGG